MPQLQQEAWRGIGPYKIMMWGSGLGDLHAPMATFCDRYAHDGIVAALQAKPDQSAVALIDTHTARLYLASDRIGQMPLYYGADRTGLFFTDTLRTLKMDDSVDKRIDFDALGLFLQYGYILSPRSILRGVAKVTPGCVLTCDLREREWSERRYWDLDSLYLKPKSENDLTQSAQMLHDMLEQTLEERLRSTRSIGAYLSGGYDSSLLVAMLQKLSPRSVHTYTIGFKECGFDESPYAEKVAAYLGSLHTTHYLEHEDLIESLTRIGRIFDEPFGDQAAIPSLIVSDMAKRDGVELLFGGDGGDEVFGANSYMDRFALLERLPLSLRRILAGGVRIAQRLFRNDLQLDARLHRYAGMLGARNSTEALGFKDMVLPPHQLGTLLSHPSFPPQTLFDRPRIGAGSHFSDLLFSRMIQTYVGHDLLRKLRAPAAFYDIEVEAPYLEPQIVTFLARIDLRIKQANGPKSLQKALLSRYLPLSLLERPKSGFSVPVMQWLRGRSRWVLEHHLGRKKIAAEGIFDAAFVERLKSAFFGHSRYYEEQLLWNLLMFELWYEEWRPFLSDHGVSTHIGAVEDHGMVAPGKVAKQ